MLLHSILNSLDELMSQLEAGKTIGVELLADRGVTASVDESVRSLFGKIAWAREGTIGRSDGSGVRMIIVDTVLLCQSTYSVASGEEQTIDEENIDGQTVCLAAGIGECYLVTEVFDSSEVITLEAETIESWNSETDATLRLAPVLSIDTHSVIGNTVQILFNTIGEEPVTFNIDWGDGDTDDGVTTPQSHEYAASGNYTITVTAINAVGQDSQTINIEIE